MTMTEKPQPTIYEFKCNDCGLTVECDDEEGPVGWTGDPNMNEDWCPDCWAEHAAEGDDREAEEARREAL